MSRTLGRRRLVATWLSRGIFSPTGEPSRQDRCAKCVLLSSIQGQSIIGLQNSLSVRSIRFYTTRFLWHYWADKDKNTFHLKKGTTSSGHPITSLWMSTWYPMGVVVKAIPFNGTPRTVLRDPSPLYRFNYPFPHHVHRLNPHNFQIHTLEQFSPLTLCALHTSQQHHHE